MVWPLTSNCPQQLFAEPHPVDRCALFTYALTLSGLRQACPDRKKQKKEIGMLLETNVWTRAGRKSKGEPEMKGDCDMATFPCTHAETHRQASLHDCSDLRRKHDWESFTARVRPSKTPRNTRTYARIICDKFHFKMTRNDLTGTKLLLVRKIKLIMAHRWSFLTLNCLNYDL